MQNTRMALIGCNQGPVFDGVFLDEPDDLVDLCVHKEFAKGFRRCHRRSPLSHLLTLPATDLIRIAQVDKVSEGSNDDTIQRHEGILLIKIL